MNKTKEITTKVHEDGRKDVTIKVNRLDIAEGDTVSEESRELAEKALGKIGNDPVLVIVLHKPTNQHTEKIVKLRHVRKYAEFAIEKFMENRPDHDNSEFAIVEHHLNSKQVKVSTL